MAIDKEKEELRELVDILMQENFALKEKNEELLNRLRLSEAYRFCDNKSKIIC